MTDPQLPIDDDELADDPEAIDDETVPEPEPELDGEPADSRVPGVTTP